MVRALGPRASERGGLGMVSSRRLAQLRKNGFSVAKPSPELKTEPKYRALELQKCSVFWRFGLTNKKEKINTTQKNNVIN